MDQCRDWCVGIHLHVWSGFVQQMTLSCVEDVVAGETDGSLFLTDGKQSVDSAYESESQKDIDAKDNLSIAV